MRPGRDYLRVDEKASALGIFVYYGFVLGVTVAPSPPELLNLFDVVADELRERYGNAEALSKDPVVQAYRKFYWRIGIDPTKVRPAGEALARRLVRGRRVPSINNVVDAGNVVSAKLLVPIGIYDLDRFEPPAVITLSEGGEVFKPIGGSEERLEAGKPVMRDARGTIMHLYPHRDSIETCVREDTRNVMIVAAGVPGVPEELVRSAAVETMRLVARFAGGKETEVWRAP